MSGLLPLHFRIEEEAIIQTVKHLRKQLTYDDFTYQADQYEQLVLPTALHPALKGIGVKILSNTAEDEPASNVKIYTDGSRIEDNVGCSFIVTIENGVIHTWQAHLQSNNSVFQSEVVAIKHAIDYLINMKIPTGIILTDSLSSLHALVNPDHRSTIIQDIQRTVRDHQSKNYYLKWVKAHVGNAGNELADQMAKEAAVNSNVLNLTIPWPYSHLKRITRLRAISKWQQQWDSSPTGRRTAFHIAYVDPDRNIGNSLLIRYIRGHGPFPTYFARHGISNSDMCVCGSQGTPEHYVTTCQLTAGQHLLIPYTNTQAYCKYLIKQSHLVRKICAIMSKLSSLGTDLCQSA
ncbi:uncharacterized protein LOC118205117 [Stegodyphus dumicola]|uniref:uncharacterized protein LOC118205117 n=1 Tax=Stegodyphus dumicola TaxID=202533 RepID=UPI0015AF9938|nr:uncharacterized protein LOC118205117 [Stegodyphus dumicola]